MEEREAFVLAPGSAIIDSPDEAIRNLNISVALLSAIIKDVFINMAPLIPLDDDTVDTFGIIEQSTASINMYLERLGLWTSKNSQES
jgi:hypothetical protein